MRKLLVLILISITTVATFIPCCQSEDCCEVDTVASHGQQEDEAEGACSPFFACATCPGSVEIPRVIQLAHPLEIKQVYHEKTELSYSSIYVFDCWQPPRQS